MSSSSAPRRQEPRNDEDSANGEEERPGARVPHEASSFKPLEYLRGYTHVIDENTTEREFEIATQDINDALRTEENPEAREWLQCYLDDLESLYERMHGNDDPTVRREDELLAGGNGKDVEEGAAAPLQIRGFMDSLDRDVEHRLKSDKKLKPKTPQQLQTLRRRRDKLEVGSDDWIRLDTDYRNLYWWRQNFNKVIKAETMLQAHQMAVRSLKKNRSGWVGQVWISPTHTFELELEDDCVGRMLSHNCKRDRGFFDQLRTSSSFTLLRKYDRQQTIDETHFRTVACEHVDDGEDRVLFTVCDIAGQHVIVSAEWVTEHLPLASVMEAYSTRSRVRIALGSSVRPTLHLPPIRHPNKPGRHECMVASFASGLHYLGFQEASVDIAEGFRQGRLRNDSTQLAGFINLVLQTMRWHHSGRIFSMRKPDPLYCPLVEAHRTSNPIWASIKAERATRGNKREAVNVCHCVCFVGDLVFDSNMETALPISRESLDAICSKIEPGSSFAGIHQSRILVVNREEDLERKGKLRLLLSEQERQRQKSKRKKQKQKNQRKNKKRKKQ